MFDTIVQLYKNGLKLLIPLEPLFLVIAGVAWFINPDTLVSVITNISWLTFSGVLLLGAVTPLLAGLSERIQGLKYWEISSFVILIVVLFI
jgi:hypothetical protein